MKDDEQLVEVALAGGPEAFAPIVERYQDAVFGVALARLRDFHDAEDVAQSVFVDAFERLGSLRSPSRLGAWLRTITIHRSIDHLRRRREGPDVEKVADVAGEARHRDESRRRELRDEILAAIGRLSKSQRETVTLFYIDGYSVAEVAEIQEVPAGTVKGRLHDAREKLKEEMIGVVENVLKSERPREDLAQRVFEVLSQRDELGDSHAIMVDLCRLGAEGAIDGFFRAAGSPYPRTRGHAINLVGWFGAPESREQITELLKRAMRDPNQGVRGGAMRAALERFACSDERKRREFVPLVVELLFDPAKRVRLRATWHLQDGWAADVPLDKAARAYLEEPNHAVRKAKEELLRAVLDAQAPRAEAPIGLGNVDERLAKLKQKLKNPSSAVRAFAVPELLCTPMDMGRKRQEIVPLVAGMLKDRSKRVRRRTAYELCGWAAHVPIKAVEEACRAETHAGPRQQMERLLRKATGAQGGAASE